MEIPKPTPTAPQTSTTGRLFPAHLAPIDRFLLDDDAPLHPMTYVIQMDCEGVFDRAAFEDALEQAIQRHPYSRALIGPGKRGMLSWIDARGDRPDVSWGDVRQPFELPDGEPIDIKKRVGLRVWVRQDESQSHVLFQWHHAVTDGTGAFRFIGDLLAAYDIAMGGDRSELLPLDPQLLRERRSRMAKAFTAGNKRAVWSAVWRQFRNVFTSWAAPLALPQEKLESTFPGVAVHTFSKQETQAIRAAADGAGAMLNDLLTERLFQALNAWNKQHPRRKSRRPLRIMMPSDLRESSETEMPVANMVGYNFLSRRARECEDPQTLLRSIAAETVQIKHAQKGKDFIDAIAACEAFPSAVPWLLRRGWCLATAVLTNNGDPARRMNARLPRKAGKLSAGGVVVQRFSGVPPLREKTHVVVAAMNYARQLAISVRCDPNAYGDKHSQQFLEEYVRWLLKTTKAPA